jgi:hypothetical protein
MLFFWHVRGILQMKMAKRNLFFIVGIESYHVSLSLPAVYAQSRELIKKSGESASAIIRSGAGGKWVIEGRC